MAFHLTSRSIALENSHILKAECKTPSGTYNPSRLPLDLILGNADGRFDWSTGGFAQSAVSIKLDGFHLSADLRTVRGDYRHDVADLSRYVSNAEGYLVTERYKPVVRGMNDKVNRLTATNDQDFVLSAENFVKIGVYVRICLSGPKTLEEWRDRYKWETLRSLFVRDPGLYDGVAHRLVQCRDDCEFYDSEIAPEVNAFGGDIAIFSDEAKEHTASIRKDLAFVAKDNSNLSDPIVAKAMENMKKSLGILESKAMARREYCKEIVGKLSKFQTVTLTSNNHILELIDRWKQNVPSLATLSQEHARYVEKAAQLKDEVKREVEAAEKERDRKEDQKYIRWGLLALGIVGQAVLAFDLLTGPTLDELRRRAKDLDNRYSTLVRDQDTTEAQYVQIITLIGNVEASIGPMQQSLGGALDGLKEIMSAFSIFTSDFKRFKQRLEDIDDDIDENDVNSTIVALKDLEKTEETWEKIANFARRFQEYSKLYLV